MAISLSLTESAAMIRAALNKYFPKTTFSVRQESYSMGCKVKVSWPDGPTYKQVEVKIGHMHGAHYAKDDCKEYHDTEHEGKLYRFHNDSLLLRRDISSELRIKAAQAFNKQQGREIIQAQKERTLGQEYVEYFCENEPDANTWLARMNDFLRDYTEATPAKSTGRFEATEGKRVSEFYRIEYKGNWTWIFFADGEPSGEVIATLKRNYPAYWSEKNSGVFIKCAVAEEAIFALLQPFFLPIDGIDNLSALDEQAILKGQPGALYICTFACNETIIYWDSIPTIFALNALRKLAEFKPLTANEHIYMADKTMTQEEIDSALRGI